MDNVIQIVTVLFILSMIAERIANFIKLKYSEQSFLKLIKFGNLKIKSNDKNEEKDRELRILKINAYCGFSVALLLNANLMLIFQHLDNPSEAIGWGHFFKKFNSLHEWDLVGLIVSEFLGCALTGLFISLGSKFWHDLLDMLYEVKGLKGKLNDLQAVEVDKMNTPATTFLQGERDVIRNEAESQLMKYDGVSFVEIAADKKQLIVHSTVPDLKLPPQLHYRFNGSNAIPIIVSNDKEEIETMSLSLAPGDEIANETPTRENAGSLGCIVKKRQSGDKYILTCYHVVKNDTLKWELFNTSDGDTNVVHPLKGKDIVGMISQAVRNDFIDAALIALHNDISVTNLHPQIGYIPNDPRVITDDDVNNKTQVKMIGLRSGYREGYIVDIHRQAYIKYIDDYHTLYDLIVIRSLDGHPFSQQGDSGSIIIDQYGYAIGLLVAGKKNISFAIPLHSVFNQLTIKF